MIAGFVLGVLLFFGAFFVLVWGESRVNIGTAIEHALHLNEHEHAGGPVTYSGGLSFAEPAVAPLLKGDYAYVERIAQTCAWVETSRETKGGGQTVVYDKRWIENVPDSDGFQSAGHDNKEGDVESRISAGLTLRVGDYELAEVTGFYAAEQIAPAVSQVKGARSVDQQWAYIASDARCSKQGGAAIGDQRLSYRTMNAGDLVTVFGKRDDKRLVPFRGQVLLARGSRDVLVLRLSRDRESQTWMYRGGGALLLWIALYFLLSPVLKLVSWIPLLGVLIRGAASVVTMLAALGAMLLFVFRGWGMPFFTSLFGGFL